MTKLYNEFNDHYGRIVLHCPGRRQHRRRTPYDDDSGRRRDTTATGIAARAWLRRNAGLPVQPGEAGSPDQAAIPPRTAGGPQPGTKPATASRHSVRLILL